ncbi:MAG: response regulator transcription factor [Cyclobacteriaceae bacterium]|jgi:DNA-binding NarL/FixJ family response regulator|nr:response regulator transcription factor [Cyclobacteriaceae bacterium]
MTPIRLLLADDHPLIREGIRSLLSANERLEIAGEAEDGQGLINDYKRLQPDVVLADIKMPRITGLEALRQLVSEFPDIRFIVLTMHEEREYVINALRFGASGYVMKNAERDELVKAIITVYEGGRYFSPEVANILADTVSRNAAPALPEVSPREKEVLDLVAHGLSTKQVADKLGISTRTVETHRINMLKKLKVSNTAELIRKAIELNIITL